MNEPKLLYHLRLTASHRPTGNTRHERDGAQLPPPALLRIVQFAEERGYYLFYCDETGAELTDTYHDFVEQAMAQANWEFNVKTEDWTRCH